MNNMKEKIIIPQKIKYISEGSNLFSLNSKSYGRKYFNNTGKFVIDQINNNQSIPQIIQHYSQEFKCSIVEAKKDIYVFLRELQFLMLLRFDDSYFKDIINSPAGDINVAGEDEYVSISKFIRQNMKKESNVFCENNNLKYYNDFTLRSRCFNNIEIIFFQYQPDGTYSNVIGINGLTNFDGPAKISLIISSDLNMHQLINFYKLVEKELISQGKKKVKLQLMDNLVNNYLTTFFSNAEFFLEAVVKYELGEHHQYIYSKYLI